MMFKARGLQVIVGAFATSALFAACAPDLKTSDGDGGAGSWAESASATSSSGQSSSSSSSSAASSSSSSGASSSSSSSSGMATPTCSDSTKNGNETDVDCGGPTCPKCAANQGCFTDSDCISSVCGAGGICAPGTCMDGVKNGTESDVDCGGSDCLPCAEGYVCTSDADCQSNMCKAGTCQKAPVFIGATVLDVKTSFTMPLPNGTQTGDLLMMFVAHGGGSATITPPMGWTTIEDGSNPNNDPRADICYKIYDVTTSLNFFMFNSDGSAILAAFRGVGYGTKGTLNNASTDTIVTAQTSTLLFLSLQNGGNEVPAIPPGFTSIGIGNGNTRSLRVAYATDQPASMYTLAPVLMAGEILPSGSLGIALY